MRIYLNKNVFDAAIERIEFLFDEFNNIIVGFSGGKDSTVVLELTLMVAKRRNRLPIKVMWIDQEAEWEATVEMAEYEMTREEVEPLWLQIPFNMTNNASSFSRFNYCWDPEQKDLWIHPQHPISKKVNDYGVSRFHELFGAIIDKEFQGHKACYISGVRTEESPQRNMGLTQSACYKYITWGAKLNHKKELYTFYPIYDWSYTDVWKAILDNDWKYNKIYDLYYNYNVPIYQMRVSSLHHETALNNLTLIQQLEPQTWERLCARIGGANTVKHLNKNSFNCPKELPYMFQSWKEYAYYIIDNLVVDNENKEKVKHQLSLLEKQFTHPAIAKDMYRSIINTVLSNDWDFTRLNNWRTNPNVGIYRSWKNHRKGEEHLFAKCPYIPEEERIKWKMS